MTVRHIVLALETDSEENFQFALSVVETCAKMCRQDGVPAAACDLVGDSATALGAQIAAVQHYVTIMNQFE